MIVRKTVLVCLAVCLLAACSAPTQAPSPTPTTLPSTTPLPPAATPGPPTATPAPTFTTTPSTYPGPASQYLPAPGDFINKYEPENSLVSDNIAAYAQIPVAPENMAAITFRTSVQRDISRLPQDGIYMRFTYWVIVAPDEASAKLFYAMGSTPEYQKQAFLVIMPEAVQKQMIGFDTLPAEKSTCDEANILAVHSDIYASFRNGVLPTPDPNAMKPVDPRVLALGSLPPDLYLYARCRVKNVLVMYWGYTPNNYDGIQAPIPNDVLVEQVNRFLKIVTSKLK